MATTTARRLVLSAGSSDWGEQHPRNEPGEGRKRKFFSVPLPAPRASLIFLLRTSRVFLWSLSCHHCAAIIAQETSATTTSTTTGQATSFWDSSADGGGVPEFELSTRREASEDVDEECDSQSLEDIEGDELEGDSGGSKGDGEADDSDLAKTLEAVILGESDDDDNNNNNGTSADIGLLEQENQNFDTTQQNRGNTAPDNHFEGGTPATDVFWWSSLDSEELGLGDQFGAGPQSEYLFTQEELAEVLRFIGDEKSPEEDKGTTTCDQQGEDLRETSEQGVEPSNWERGGANSRDTKTGFTPQSEFDETALLEDPILEDFQFRNINNDDDSDLLLPVDDLDNLSQIFDGDEEASNTSATNQDIPTFKSTTSAKQSSEQDLVAQDILEQLQGLSLSLPPLETNNNDDDDDSSSSDIPPLQDIEERTQTPGSFSDSNHEQQEQVKPQHQQFQEGDGDVPPYFYCQPCSDSLSSDNLYWTDIDNMMAELGIDPQDEQPGETNSYDDDQVTEPTATPRTVASPAILAAAQPFLETFGAKPTFVQKAPLPEPPHSTKSSVFEQKGERVCLGHRERILNVRFSADGMLMATASADSTIRIWRPATNELLCTLTQHNSKYECLRVAWASSEWFKAANCAEPREQATPETDALLATAGADGQVFVFKRKANAGSREEWKVMARIDHSQDLNHFTPTDAEDKPQIYSLQFIDNWQVSPSMHCTHGNNRVLLTSSENHIHIWELVQEPKRQEMLTTVMEENDDDHDEASQSDEKESMEYPWHFREVFSIGFGDLHSMGYGVSVGRVTQQANQTLPFTNVSGSIGGAFGGERNPNGVIFVFDAAYCPTNGLLGVALSDGSLRLLNGRGVCVSVLQLPGVSTHLTSFCWDATGTQLATSVASTGHVVTWEILLNESRSDVQKTTCRAVLGGGHEGTVFGMRYCGRVTGNEKPKTEPFLVSWGVDGRVVLWDAQAEDEVDAPVATLVNNPEYPIYGVDFDERTRYMVLVGGSGDGGFIGIPAKIFDVFPESRQKTSNLREENLFDSSKEEDASKKLKLSDEKK